MNTALKIGGYTLGLLAVFGAAVGIGAAVTPTATSAATSVAISRGPHRHVRDDATAPAAGAASLPGGLMVSQDGYTLRLADRSVPAGPQVPLRFQILGPDGAPVTGYQTEHDKDLHLIAVRRDLSHFQHVHPVLDARGHVERAVGPVRAGGVPGVRGLHPDRARRRTCPRRRSRRARHVRAGAAARTGRHRAGRRRLPGHPGR